VTLSQQKKGKKETCGSEEKSGPGGGSTSGGVPGRPEGARGWNPTSSLRSQQKTKTRAEGLKRVESCKGTRRGPLIQCGWRFG